MKSPCLIPSSSSIVGIQGCTIVICPITSSHDPRPSVVWYKREGENNKDIERFVHRFWPKSMHEPLNILVVLPLSFIPNYRGPWVMRGSDRSNDYRAALDTHYRRARGDETGKLHVMEGPLPDLRGGTATEPRDILRKFLAEAGSVQAMPVRLPRGVLQTAPERQISRAKRTRR